MSTATDIANLQTSLSSLSTTVSGTQSSILANRNSITNLSNTTAGLSSGGYQMQVNATKINTIQYDIASLRSLMLNRFAATDNRIAINIKSVLLKLSIQDFTQKTLTATEAVIAKKFTNNVRSELKEDLRKLEIKLHNEIVEVDENARRDRDILKKELERQIRNLDNKYRRITNTLSNRIDDLKRYVEAMERRVTAEQRSQHQRIWNLEDEVARYVTPGVHITRGSMTY
jgi:hypothetical protein